MELAGLFTAAFLAATLLPAQSEAVLIALLLKGDVAPWLLVATASAGNVLGAIVNWLLGRFLEHFRHRSWFPVSEAALVRAQRWYHKVGRWSLLLSWLPVVGDPLTVVAGTLREPLGSFVLLVAIGKVGRYVVLAVATLGVAG
ncbi:DedA family protein [Mesorhizobium sp. BR1-1-16]|uniref:YqaA family protein n=1 Tax=Mesorhizobium sp. BR1-1-16 TaxID=2876653 RepID=UPI001CCDC86C|nr:YqaA family protein [Mesorhizobium sp. BR1-1-16]MBZ9935413.1 DedA family protein [Mesorhizobium sp. BR1-1-16]